MKFAVAAICYARLDNSEIGKSDGISSCESVNQLAHFEFAGKPSLDETCLGLCSRAGGQKTRNSFLFFLTRMSSFS
jgi:hypothetical protein